MGWAWIPLIAMLAVMALRFWTVYWAGAPGLLPDGSLLSAEQIAARYKRMQVLFVFNVLSAPAVLALCFIANGKLAEHQAGIDIVRAQLWTLCLVLVGMLLVLAWFAGRREVRIAKTVPALSGSATPVKNRLFLIGIVALPLALLLAAFSVENAYWVFSLEGAAFLLIILSRTLFTRRLVKTRVQLSEEDTLAIHVRELFEREGVKPKTFIVTPSMAANGFVLGSGVVALTTALTWLLSQDEVSAVMVHELSHYRHGDRRKLIAMRLLFAVSILLVLFGLEYLLVQDPAVEVVLPGTIANLLIMGTLLTLATGLVSRRIEFRCDAAALKAGCGPELASALQKMTRYAGLPESWNRLHSLFITHPPTADRAARLQTPTPPPP